MTPETPRNGRAQALFDLSLMVGLLALTLAPLMRVF